jgi:hypothetical protein
MVKPSPRVEVNKTIDSGRHSAENPTPLAQRHRHRLRRRQHTQTSFSAAESLGHIRLVP